MSRIAALLVLFCLVSAAASDAGQAVPFGADASASAEPSANLPPGFDGPPPPVLPETIARDGLGRTTLRAVRLTAPLRLDGQLDEAVYREVSPASDFIQTEPTAGSRATERTELWILFDDDNVYVTARLWETEPDRMVINEMRRDGPNLMQNETFSIFLDTFYDRRNGFVFIINPIGARTDGQGTNGQYDRDWNTIWDVKLGRFDGGWTAEMAIPFKSLRYRPGRAQVWGFNARRINRWKNEMSHLVPIPNTVSPPNGLLQASWAATVVGLEAPSASKNLEIKPYAISELATDRQTTPTIANNVDGDIGVDVKYGITRGLTADFTYNTDFAQVEADEQQINLTRFSLFFPERREFFLENQGMFGFGGGARVGGDSSMPILFYSRRIGLNQGREVPIEVGGRLTGRMGRYSLGLVNIQTGDAPVSGFRSTNFSVVRVRRDVLRKSSIGVIATGRSVAVSGSGTNAAYGLDGTFSFFDHLDINTYWARTRTDRLIGDDTSYRAQLDYSADRYGLQLERLGVGNDFNPEVGFVPRNDMQRTSGTVRFSPRPRAIRSVRKFSWTGSMAYVENGTGHLETREWEAEFGTEFQSSDRLSLSYTDTYEFLPQPFRIASGVTVPVGGYTSSGVRAGFNFGQQRRLSGNLSAQHGTFYSGQKTAIGFSTGRMAFGLRLSMEPTFSVNWVDLVEGSFTTTLVGSRVVYTITPRVFTTALLQYSSASRLVSSNVRLRWEYRPGSELFVVLNEERDTLARRFPDLANRAIVVKINRLFRF